MWCFRAGARMWTVLEDRGRLKRSQAGGYRAAKRQSRCERSETALDRSRASPRCCGCKVRGPMNFPAVPHPRVAQASGDGAELGAVSVIIPVYNEEESIPILFDRLFPVLERLSRPFEVIAVNDGSADRSIDVLTRAAAVRPELKVL